MPGQRIIIIRQQNFITMEQIVLECWHIFQETKIGSSIPLVGDQTGAFGIGEML